jgi:DNA polymerase-3 subunit alpha
MNLAFKYPIIFWNCACLISDCAGTEKEDEEIKDDYYEPVSSTSDFLEEDDEDDEDDEDEELEEKVEVKKKKKNSTTDYGKISTAINKIKSTGVKIVPPDVNSSSFAFKPDPENNTIIYGLKGISKIGDELVGSIIANRPYESLEDFLGKNKINKAQVINLIKAGAFDKFGNDRTEIMRQYILSISDQKKELNLRNMQMLITYNLLPEELEFEKKVFNFNKFIKKNCKVDSDYKLYDYPLSFYSSNFEEDDIRYETEDDILIGYIDQKKWDKRYTKIMDKVRDYIKINKSELLNKLNTTLYNEQYDKYCSGNLSKWEMDSISFYNHEHELANVSQRQYGWVNFFKLKEEPEIDNVFNTPDGKQIPLYKIVRIAGTVLDKDKNKKLLSILTTDGVVTVKLFGDAFTKYDRQISEKNELTGKKKVIEKSMFARGSIIVVTGIRRGDAFIAKKYKRTPYHLVEKIVNIDEDGNFEKVIRE